MQREKTGLVVVYAIIIIIIKLQISIWMGVEGVENYFEVLFN
jgi:hypothetical protein